MEVLVRDHQRTVWRYLCRHGASSAEADDLVQDAFVIGLQKGAARFEPAAARSFLLRTARFLFLRRRRGDRGVVQLADEVDRLWDRDAAAANGDERLAALRACVAALPPRGRRAVEIAYGLAGEVHGRRVIGRELGLGANGVKTMMQRLRAWLRDCVERRLR